MPKRLTVYKIADLPRETRLHEGRMKRYSMRTKGAQIVYGDIAPQPREKQGNHRTPHDHPYDMLLVVLGGTMMQDVEGIEYRLDAGSAMVVPAYYMHRGYAHGDVPASLFEVFAPARTDYIDLVEYQTDYPDKGKEWTKGETFTWNKFTRNDPNKSTPLPVYRLADLPADNKQQQGRMRRTSIRTEHAQIVWGDITPVPKAQQGHHGAPHDHPHEMLLMCHRGHMRMEVDGQDYDMPAGTAMIVPAFAMHRGHAAGDETTSIMEVFAPARLDYNDLVTYQKETFTDKGAAWVKPGSNSWNTPPGG